jgi:glycosyltransferase involved in cell wall biosynthesis
MCGEFGRASRRKAKCKVSHRMRFEGSLDLSIIIPTHNRSALLKRTLEGFCRQDSGELRWELIVVSDGSTDSSHETVMQFKDRLPVRYFSQTKRGVSSARNLGLREARSPIVLFLDDDVIPSPQLIAEHARFHQEQPDLESVLLGYVTWSPELRITPFMWWYGECGGLFGFSKLQSGQPADPRFLYTCNLSFKTEFLSRHGGFNESLTVLEDHELGYRLSKDGMKMKFLKEALGYHYQTFTFDQACQRLSRYSSGLPAFLLTDAGKRMLKRNARISFRIAEWGVRASGPALQLIRPLADTNIPLPNAIYRLLYWYFATHKSFWHPATKGKVTRHESRP